MAAGDEADRFQAKPPWQLKLLIWESWISMPAGQGFAGARPASEPVGAGTCGRPERCFGCGGSRSASWKPWCVWEQQALTLGIICFRRIDRRRFLVVGGIG